MMNKPQTNKKPLWMNVGEVLDGLFLGFTAVMACTTWYDRGFETSIPYFILNGVWCCSSALANISYKLGANK